MSLYTRAAAVGVAVSFLLPVAGAEVAGRRGPSDLLLEPEAVESLWLSPQNGLFLDPLRWSGGVAPNNTADTVYDAVINAAGGAYVVTLENGDVSLRSLTIDSADATFRHVSGTLDVPGVIDIKAGVYELRNATVRNATIRQSGGAFDISTTTSTVATLEDVTLEGGEFQWQRSNTRLAVVGDLTLSGASVRFGGSSARLHLDDADTILGGEILFAGTNWQMTSGPGELTIGSGASLVWQTQGSWLGDGVTLINQGEMRADSTFFNSNAVNILGVAAFQNESLVSADNRGQTLITADVWSNSGEMVADGNGVIRLSGAGVNTGSMIAKGQSILWLDGDWVNNGVIAAQGGTVRLGGLYSTSAWRGIEVLGGQVEIRGILDNTGDTITIDSSSVFRMGGGTVKGGAIDIQPGAPTTRYTGLLEGVAVSGPLRVGYVGGVLDRLRFDSADLAQAELRVGFNGGVTIDTNTVLPEHIYLEGGILNGVVADSVIDNTTVHLGVSQFGVRSRLNGLTIGENAVIDVVQALIGTGNINASGSHLTTNYGRIIVDGEGRNLSLYQGSVLVNHGTMEAANGGRIVLLSAPSFQNNGEVVARDGGLVVLSGYANLAQFYDSMSGVRSEGTGVIGIGNDIFLEGTTLTIDASTGNLGIVGGTIWDGEIHFHDGMRLVGLGGRLNGVTIRAGGDFVLDRQGEILGIYGSGVTLPDGDLVLKGEGAALYYASGSKSLDSYSITASPLPSLPGSQSSDRVIEISGIALTISDGRSVTGGALSIQGVGNAFLVNNGLLGNDWSGSTMHLESTITTLTNHGVVRAAGGGEVRISAAQWTNHGVAEATGGGLLRIMSPDWTNLGTLRASSGGELWLSTLSTTLGGIEIDNATLRISPSFTTPQLNLNNLAFSGDSRMIVSGLWENTGHAAVFPGAPPAITLQGGQLRGGTFDLGGADISLLISGTLQNTTIHGADVLLDSQATLRHGGVVSLVGGEAKLRGAGARMDIVTGVSTIGYTVSLETPTGAAPAMVSFVNNSQNTISAAGGFVGGHATLQGPLARLTNNGVISSDRDGASIMIALLSGQFTNNGVVEARSGGALEVFATNIMNISGGALTGGVWRSVGDGSRLDLADYTITKNAADVELSGVGSRFDAIDGLTENAGRFALMDGRGFDALGGARVGVFTNTGELALGVGSVMHVHADYASGPDAALTVWLGAGGAGGLLRVDGVATLDGELRIVLQEGFTPVIGSEWTIVTAAELTGGFSSVVGGSLGGGLSLAVSAQGGAVTLTAVPAPGAAGVLLLLGLGRLSRRRRAAA